MKGPPNSQLLSIHANRQATTISSESKPQFNMKFKVPEPHSDAETPYRHPHQHFNTRV